MERFDSLNGYRAIAAIGIVMMHVFANANYKLNDNIECIINSFTQLVYLFMIISSFSMCCGYYEKIKNNKITVNEFYKKRFSKILPFFGCLVIINILFERNIETLIEGFANFTLMFGFLPVSSLNTIGVGWFLGVVFVFYMIFPFFVFLFDNKKRAWFVFILALIFNILCPKYFFTEKFGLINYWARTNFLYDFVYFCLGGILYLYRSEIKQIVSKYKIITVMGMFLITILYYFIPDGFFTIKTLILFAFWMLVAIGINNCALNNKFLKFISTISMEIYLSHMLIFRIVEKLKLTNLFTNDYVSYLFTTVLVITVTILFAKIFKVSFEILINKINAIRDARCDILKEK